MDRSRKWLAFISITALVLVTLLGGIVSAMAGNGDGQPAAEQLVIGEGTESIVPVAEAAPVAEEEADAPAPEENAEQPADEEEKVAIPLGESPLAPPDAVTECFPTCRHGKICVIKFLDANENGVKDAGETIISGVTILLNGQDPKQTDGDGKVCYDNLGPGDYTVSEVVPDGYHATTPTSYKIQLCSDQTVTKYFGNAPNIVLKGSISGHKWLDPNGDGSFEDKTPLEGVTIELWKGGEKIATTTTAADGSYSFGDLDPGDYTVKEIVPGGMVAISPVSVDVTVAEGQDVEDADFYNKEEVCDDGIIEAVVRVDDNCDGEFTGDDSLLDGVTFKLYHIEENGDLTPVSPPSMISGPGWGFEVILFVIKIPVYYPGGHVIWENLPRAYAGEEEATYRLVMETPEGYTAISPTSYDLTLHNCPWPCYWFRKDFLLSRNSHLRGHKWEDVNGNGVYDPGTDKPLEGWTIELYNEDGSFRTSTTTNAAGEYSFDDLPEGIYTVKEVLQEGWAYSYPEDGIFEDVPVGCGDVDGKDFLNSRYLYINGHKYEDANCSGVIDDGDPGVPGVEVKLFIYNEQSSEWEEVASTTTGEDGYYEFTGLAPGTYKVQEILTVELLKDWFIVSPDEGIYAPVVLEDQGAEDKDFLNARYVSISGNKWEDLDCDGELDEGEPPVEGVTIELWKDGVKIAETTTGADGSYSFTNLLPGTYTVKEVLPEGWYPTNPESGMYPDIELVCGQPIEGLDFLNCRYGSICGYKYADLNENGIMGEGEEGLDGITIELNDGEYSTVTADGGKFCFENLPPGTYKVTVDESTAIGYYPTGPISIEVDLNPGEKEMVYFGNAPYGSISGKKWLDVNYDGVWDEDETVVIEGITINLYAGNPPEGDPIATTVTGEDGYYEFTDLKAGVYTVEEEGGEGYFSCTSDSVEVTLSAGEGAVVDFGNCPYGRIEGLKFLDLNGDGVQDPDEPGLEGVEITLTGLGDVGAMAKTISGEDGTFVFNKLLPGEYAVAETVPAGYYATRPIIVEVVVGPGESISVVFANAPYGSIVGNKWIDDGDNQLDPSKDTPKAGMTIKLTGETKGGEPVSMETTTGEDGSYSFLLLEAGNYNVTEIYDPEKMKAVTPDSIDVTLEPGAEGVVDFLNVEFEVGGEEITPPAGGTLPSTGMGQLPLLIAAAMLVLLGLALLAAGLRRRYQE